MMRGEQVTNVGRFNFRAQMRPIQACGEGESRIATEITMEQSVRVGIELGDEERRGEVEIHMDRVGRAVMFKRVGAASRREGSASLVPWQLRTGA